MNGRQLTSEESRRVGPSRHPAAEWDDRGVYARRLMTTESAMAKLLHPCSLVAHAHDHQLAKWEILQG